ncbi:transposase [Streptomyces sp. NPDC003691]
MGFGQPLLPRAVRGRRRPDDRTVANEIVRKSRTGVTSREMPEQNGSRATPHARFRR